MLASELVTMVQMLIHQHGDLRVLHADDGSIVDTASVEVLSSNMEVERVILISGRTAGASVLPFSPTRSARALADASDG